MQPRSTSISAGPMPPCQEAWAHGPTATLPRATQSGCREQLERTTVARSHTYHLGNCAGDQRRLRPPHDGNGPKLMTATVHPTSPAGILPQVGRWVGAGDLADTADDRRRPSRDNRSSGFTMDGPQLPNVGNLASGADLFRHAQFSHPILSANGSATLSQQPPDHRQRHDRSGLYQTGRREVQFGSPPSAERRLTSGDFTPPTHCGRFAPSPAPHQSCLPANGAAPAS